MKIEVLNFVELEDGSGVMTVEMDAEMISAMAKIGLLKVLTDAADQTIKEHGVDGEP